MKLESNIKPCSDDRLRESQEWTDYVLYKHIITCLQCQNYEVKAHCRLIFLSQILPSSKTQRGRFRGVYGILRRPRLREPMERVNIFFKGIFLLLKVLYLGTTTKVLPLLLLFKDTFICTRSTTPKHYYSITLIIHVLLFRVYFVCTKQNCTVGK